jgi:tRNA nucleotidyltransferase/poly(A) polymerase
MAFQGASPPVAADKSNVLPRCGARPTRLLAAADGFVGSATRKSEKISPVHHPLDSVLVSLLAPADVYAVGGRVRDEYRAQFDGRVLVPKDLDYVVTGMPAPELIRRLSTAGAVDVVGASFAVVKFRHAAGEADIALPRREHSTGSGHRDFSIESGPDIPIADDLGRRDFRMNMIARRLRDDEIVDPFGGIGDIQARRIDTVSNLTFVEDPLRLLRAAQFAARFAFNVSDRARSGMTAAAGLSPTVSPDRIGDEMRKMLTLAAAPSTGLELLRETGVLIHLWPELLEGVGVDQNEWHAYDVYRHSLVTLDATPAGDFTLRLAALLHDVGKPRTKDGPHFYRHEHVGADLVPDLLGRLRLSQAVVESVTHLVRQHMYSADPELAPKAIRRFVQRMHPEQLERLFALRAADIAGSGLPKRDDSNERFQERVFAVVAEAPAASVRDLAISGRDVIEVLQRRGAAGPGFAGDPRVGKILRALFERVTDEPQLNERSVLHALAEELAAEV